jgi:hypothetical protein
MHNMFAYICVVRADWRLEMINYVFDSTLYFSIAIVVNSYNVKVMKRKKLVYVEKNVILLM